MPQKIQHSCSFMKTIAELRNAECPTLGLHPSSSGTGKGPQGHSEEIFLPGVLLTRHRDKVLGNILQRNHSKLFPGMNSKLTWMSQPHGWGISVVTDVSIESLCSQKQEIMPTDQTSCTRKHRD